MKIEGKQRAILIVGIVAILIGVFIFTPSGKDSEIDDWLKPDPRDIVPIGNGHYVEAGRRATTSTPAATQPTPSSGVMEINQTEWRGVTCLDGRMRTDAKILTDNTWWEMRLDRDDKLIFQLYPRHWKPGSHLEITNNFTVMEWRVKPGQTNNFAQVAWSISPVAAN